MSAPELTELQAAGPRAQRAVLLATPLVALAAALVLSASVATTDSTMFEEGAYAVAAAAAAALALVVHPAWPLSIGIVLGAFSSHWDEMGTPFAGDRLLVGAAMISILLRERARGPGALRTRPIDWLLALVAIYALTSAALVGTLDAEQAQFALLDRLGLLGFVLFFVAPRVYREPAARRVFLGALVALGGYLGLTALFETVGLDALVFPEYIKDEFVGTHHDRARGPFAEAAANGLALYSCAVASALAVLTWRDRRWRIVAAAVLVLCALGILFTVTRAAWIASGAATVITLLAVRETRRYILYVLVTAAAGVLIAFALVPGLQGKAESRADDDRPIWDRRNANSAAVRMLHEKPLFGFGWFSFQFRSHDYYRQSPDFPLTFQRNLHNVYLSNAVELGLVGAALWIFALLAALIGSMVRRGPPELRPWKIGLVALTVCYLISALSTPLSFSLPVALLWTWAGVARGET